MLRTKLAGNLTDKEKRSLKARTAGGIVAGGLVGAAAGAGTSTVLRGKPGVVAPLLGGAIGSYFGFKAGARNGIQNFAEGRGIARSQHRPMKKTASIVGVVGTLDTSGGFSKLAIAAKTVTNTADLTGAALLKKVKLMPMRRVKNKQEFRLRLGKTDIGRGVVDTESKRLRLIEIHQDYQRQGLGDFMQANIPKHLPKQTMNSDVAFSESGLRSAQKFGKNNPHAKLNDVVAEPNSSGKLITKNKKGEKTSVYSIKTPAESAQKLTGTEKLTRSFAGSRKPSSYRQVSESLEQTRPFDVVLGGKRHKGYGSRDKHILKGKKAVRNDPHNY